MPQTKVINVRSLDGQRWPEDAVYIGRASKGGRAETRRSSPYANPYAIVVGRQTREEAVRKYGEWLKGKPELVERARAELKGKTLVCWCRPPQGFQGKVLCHGQIVAGVVDGVRPEEVT